MPTVWISVLTSFGCFEGSRAIGSVFQQLFRKPEALSAVERERRVPRVVECKIELTFVKLGAAYYGMWHSMYIDRTRGGATPLRNTLMNIFIMRYPIHFSLTE